METGIRKKKRKETVDNNKTVILQDLLKYDRIVVQCHNVPDADALASGFALVTAEGRKSANPICFS